MMKLATRMHAILMIALFVVASDHGNFLLRKSLIKPFPIPMRKEYMDEISRVSIKLFRLYSSVKNRKKNKDVPSDIQSNMMKSLRFMGYFLAQI